VLGHRGVVRGLCAVALGRSDKAALEQLGLAAERAPRVDDPDEGLRRLGLSLGVSGPRVVAPVRACST
jgi:hypothetical protein